MEVRSIDVDWQADLERWLGSRPPSEWIALKVPAIIDEEAFNAVQDLLKSRNPKGTPPRGANGPTFLAGLARCGPCNAALIQNTGKGGLYRCYCCSSKLKKGPTACKGPRMPMDKLDGIAIGEATRRILEPQRLTEMLQTYVKIASDREDGDKDRLAKLRHARKEAEAGITRLLGLVESGLMDSCDAALRDGLIGLKLQRNSGARQIADFQKRMVAGEPKITPGNVGRLAILLRDKLHHGPPEIRQAYARLLMDEVKVDDREIRISGSKLSLQDAQSRTWIFPRPQFSLLFRNGALDRIRTCDPCLRRAVLYPAELRVHRGFSSLSLGPRQ